MRITGKDYCDYETSVALKELGYNGTVGECSHFGAFYMGGKEIFYDRLYNSELKENECLRVPLYLAQKWLREKKGIIADVSFSPFGYFASIYTNVRNVESEILEERFKFEWSEKLYGEEEHDSYEGALLEGIKGAVKILKEK